MVLHPETKNWRKNHCTPTFFRLIRYTSTSPCSTKIKVFSVTLLRLFGKSGIFILPHFQGAKSHCATTTFQPKALHFRHSRPPSLNPVSQASHSKKVICRICNPKICSVCICATDKQIFECYTWSTTEWAKVPCSSQTVSVGGSKGPKNSTSWRGSWIDSMMINAAK